MNNVNFLNQQSYPLSSETGDFLQNMIALVARLSSFGGASYILSGCTKTGNNYAPGYMVINGEILPFDGGAAVSQSHPGGSVSDYAVIQENNDNVQVYDTLYPNAYTRRKVVCGMGATQFDLKNLVQVPTIQALNQSIYGINASLSGMSSAINGKAPSIHSHTMAQVTGLVDALAGKSATGHGHTASEISNMPKGAVVTATVNIGDCPYDDGLKIITFPSGIVLPNINYIVAGSLRSTFYGGDGDSNSRYDNDNDVFWMVRTKRIDGFSIALREVTHGTQYLEFDYAIIMI